MVKNGEAVVSIGDENRTLQKDESFSLEVLRQDTEVCRLSGEGEVSVVTDSVSKLLTKKKPCVMIEAEERFDLVAYMKKYWNAILLFSDSKEPIKSAVSIKGGESEKVEQVDYRITDDKKPMVIYSEKFAPLPVILTLKDAKGNEIKEIAHEALSETLFVVPVESVKSGYSVVLTNSDKKVLLDIRFLK